MLQRERLARGVAAPRGTGNGGAGVLRMEKRRRIGGNFSLSLYDSCVVLERPRRRARSIASGLLARQIGP